MADLKNSNFALFFTRGLSLAEWERIGILEREIKPYIELARHFNKIYLFTYGGPKDKSYSGLLPGNIRIISKPEYMPALLYSFILPLIHKKCLKTVKIIKTNQMDGSWAAVLAKKLYGEKLVVRCGYEWLNYLEAAKSSYLKRKIAYCAEKFAYKNADRVIITSEDEKNFIIKRFGTAHNKIEVIPNYIDTNKFIPMGIKKEPRVIFVGRLEPVKNINNLIDAMTRLNNPLTLIGEGSLREELEKHALAKSVKVEFKGRVSQAKLPEELNKSEIFIFPSLGEGNPKALLEAMACGLPCAGTDVKGINSIIKNGENGLLCGTDTASIHNALKSLLNDKGLGEKISANARKTIVEDFSFEKIIKKESNLYDQILGQRK